MGYFSKSSGVIVSISEFDRTEDITKDVYPIYNIYGAYIGYVDNGKVILVNENIIDPFGGEN